MNKMSCPMESTDNFPQIPLSKSITYIWAIIGKNQNQF